MNTDDDLDQKTDDEISAILALEVAQWTYWPADSLDFRSHEHWRDSENEVHVEPAFATDASAVLPWLEKWQKEEDPSRHRLVKMAYGHGYLGVGHFCTMHGEDHLHVGYAPSFARAACVALIRAKRAQPK